MLRSGSLNQDHLVNEPVRSNHYNTKENTKIFFDNSVTFFLGRAGLAEAEPESGWRSRSRQPAAPPPRTRRGAGGPVIVQAS